MAGSAILMFAMLLSGGPTDLLDLMSSAAYWKAKNVTVSVEALKAELAPEGAAPDIAALIKELGAAEFDQREAAQQKIEALGAGALPQLQAASTSLDPEVGARCKAIIEKLSQGGRATQVRRLMAMRTLGELKNKEALPILRALLQSKQMFEADYAAAAIAVIEGKPYSRPRATVAVRAADLGLMPGGLGAVGQVAPAASGAALNLDKMFEQMAPMARMSKEDMSAKALEEMIKVAEMIGNVRFDCATFGVADNIGDRRGTDNGYFVLIARGSYDRSALVALITNKAEGRKFTVREEKGVQIVELHPDAVLLMPSNELLVLMASPPQDKLPTADMLASLTSGAGKMAANADLVKVIKTVDTTKPLWAAVKVSDFYRQAPPLAPFDTVTLVAEPKGQAMDIAIKATGSDKDKTAEVVKMVTDGVQQGLASMKQAAQQMPNMAGAFKDIIDTMESIKATADGGNATLTGTLKSGAGSMMMPMMMYWRAPMAAPQVAPAQARPAPAQP